VGAFALVDVATVPPDHTVVCDVVPHGMRETFVTTVSLFVNDAGFPPRGAGGEPLVPLSIALEVSDVAGKYERITASNALVDEHLLVAPDQWCALRFRWERQTQRRDFCLVLIGALAAFGAAMLIEAARPFIDRLGADEHPSSRPPPA
jgi:hypothetical protein